jgi:hypothetical protein
MNKEKKTHMLRTPALLAVGSLAWLLTAPAATAQESATLVTRSGERVAGQLVDMNASGLTVRQNGRDRQLATNDVAVIEFSDAADISAEARGRLSTGGQFVVLRNGQTIEARLVDIGGAMPLRLSFETSTGPRDMSSSEIARVYLSSPPAAPADRGGQAAERTAAVQGRGGQMVLTLPGNRQWVQTDIQVQRGETLAFQTSGQVRLSPSPSDVVAPAGAKQPVGVGAPLASAQRGALLGRIDQGQPFPIGGRTSMAMPASGTLWLGINDDLVDDNGGEFQVIVSRPRR